MEFFVGQRVRFTPDAEVSPRLIVKPAKVEGYDEVDDVDYVIVIVDGIEQWVLPDELVPD